MLRLGFSAGLIMIHVILEFGARNNISWAYKDAIHYNFTESTDFTEFQSILEQDVQTFPLHDFSNLDPQSMLPHITKVLRNAGKL